MSYETLPTRQSDAGPDAPHAEARCECGSVQAVEDIWSCQHRNPATGKRCLKACCPECTFSEANFQLECCDNHIEASARRRNQIIERLTKALRTVAAQSGNQWAKAECNRALTIPECMDCGDLGLVASRTRGKQDSFCHCRVGSRLLDRAVAQ